VTLPILAAIGQTLLGVLLSLMAVFLILLVLVQRGRGGGLAGALGGMGGSSAFGAKAGDVFTRITIVAASIWIILCMVTARLSSGGGESRINLREPSGAAMAPAADDDKASEPATGEPASAGGPAAGEDAAADNATPPAEPAPPVSEP